MDPKGWNILSSHEAMKDLSLQDQTTVLARRDWIDAGLELLVGKGVDHVKITRLADALGVTRGSFYWHFKDRDDLLSALVEDW
jgi:AcrR family transcriptional regulator